MSVTPGHPVRSAVALLGLTLFAVWSLAADPKPASNPAPQEKPWAFRTPQRPTLPKVANAAWVRNPLDRFILAKLEEEGIQPAPEADAITLLRRVTFDLTGLPPTPEEIAAFVEDRSPQAYDKVVDRLLNSERFGERAALSWLDLVRFAETDGFKSDDTRAAAWRYRDYVIRSFNQDKPYDRFIREQLAGDELYPDDGDALVATGYNRHYPDEYNAVNLEQRRQEILNDMTDTTSAVFLGLTVGCARCHDHKFDPITQEDYYRIQAFFAGYFPADVPVGNREENERYRQQLRAWEEKTAELRKQMAELEEPYRKQLTAKQKSRFPVEYQEMYDLPPEKRTPLQVQIATMVARQVDGAKKDAAKSMKGETRTRWEAMNQRMTEFNRLKPPAPPSAMTLTEVGPVAPATHLLKRGDWRHPDKEIPPGYLSMIEDRYANIPAPRPEARTTGRRSVLATWLTSPDNPLTARVIVNRLWQQHFGRGIVATPSDFGAQGDTPTHPELLDWLAVEFVTPSPQPSPPGGGEGAGKGQPSPPGGGEGRVRGWSLKAMHRLMVTSATYRQASRTDPKNLAADPDNAYFSRMNRRRLEGEALRDAILSVSGQLNLKAGGPSVYPEIPAELGPAAKGNWTPSPDPAERNRRSVYVFAKRNLRYPLFGAFDAPDPNETCARRYVSTNAPQALMLLNSKLILDLARNFADRVTQESGNDPARVLDRAYRLALGRSPDSEEAQKMQTFLAKGTVADLCHVLLNVNEFLYVD